MCATVCLTVVPSCSDTTDISTIGQFHDQQKPHPLISHRAVRRRHYRPRIQSQKTAWSVVGVEPTTFRTAATADDKTSASTETATVAYMNDSQCIWTYSSLLLTDISYSVSPSTPISPSVSTSHVRHTITTSEHSVTSVIQSLMARQSPLIKLWLAHDWIMQTVFCMVFQNKISRSYSESRILLLTSFFGLHTVSVLYLCLNNCIDYRSTFA